ncbi:MAG TPA: DUF6788 family protein [Ktedonobacteraceae bacterium]|nr:DUF6788 family protein [Ktedonobacteraceae bacterium]
MMTEEYARFYQGIDAEIAQLRARLMKLRQARQAAKMLEREERRQHRVEVKAQRRQETRQLLDAIDEALSQPRRYRQPIKTPRRSPGANPMTYQLQYRRCGKPTCSTCQKGAGHGPYWYLYWRDGAKLRSRYLGKTKPEEEAGTDAALASAAPA